MFRFVNLIHLNIQIAQWNEDKVKSVLQEIRSDISFDKKCGSDGLYSYKVINAQVKKVEERLTIKSHDTRLDNVTNKDLQSGAEMFIYLNICQDLQRSWFLFYTDLLQNQSPDQMILTLSRVFKGGTASRTTISRKLFDRIASVLSLKYENVSSLLKGKLSPLTEKENLNNVEGTFLI